MMLGFIFFTLAFTLLAWKHFPIAVAVCFTLLPTYLIRFSVGPLPSTLLEVMILILIILGVLKYGADIKNSTLQLEKSKLVTGGILFIIIGATIGLFVATDLRAALGEWKAFYIEPILLMLVLLGVSIKEPNLKKYLLKGLVMGGITTALLAIYQGITGDLLAPGYQGRATGWYGFPNGVGLYLGILWPIVVATTVQSKRHDKLTTAFLTLAPLALFFSKSTGALIAILGTVGALFLLHKKTRTKAIVLGLVGFVLLLSVPQLSFVKQELLFQDRSGQIRVSMWQEATNFLFAHPIVGSGLASYSEAIVPYHTTVNGEGIEIFHHPHNIFLTMWTNAGVLGLIGLIFLFVGLFSICIKQKEYAMIAMLIGILILGMVDSPYIKNDLAVVFWMIPLLILINQKESHSFTLKSS